MTEFKKNKSISLRLLLSENLRTRIMEFSFPTAFILGIYGFLNYPLGEETVTFSNAMYHSAQLFIMHTPHFGAPVPWSLETARWLAVLSTGLVLYNAALHILHKERMGLRIRRMKNHTIVCGLGRRGIAVTEKLHESGNKVVAIDKNPEPDIVQRLQTLGIPLIIGDATRKEILEEARIEYAARLFTFCSDDTTNFSIAMESLGEPSKIALTRKCFIHINDAELRNTLQTNHEKKSFGNVQTHRFIDAYGPEAITLLAEGLPLEHDGILADDIRKVHLIILGFGCMGRTLAVKAAQLGQFANRKKMLISVIDHNAKVNQAALLFHHPFIEDVVDFEFFQQEVLSPETRKQIEKWCIEADRIVNVVVCFDNPSIVYDTVFNLMHVFNRSNVRVAVRANDPDSFKFLLRGAGTTKYKDLRIQPFGLDKGLETLINPENVEAEKFAVDIHKAYVELIFEEESKNPNQTGKVETRDELKSWDNLKEDFRESNRQQAVHMYFKVRACGYEIVALNDPHPSIEEFEKGLSDVLAIMEHDRWVAERKVNNWKFGDPSDKANRINKNLVDWDKLEPKIQQYDYDAVARIPRLLKKVGKKMVVK